MALLLAVDDSLVILTELRFCLEDLGHDLIAAESGQESLDLLAAASELPDLIIMDVNMPGIDGFETARAIKQAYTQVHIPIVFLTADTSPDIHRKCLEYGDDYMAKPFNEDMLEIKIKAHLRVAQLTKEMSAKQLKLEHQQRLIDEEHNLAEMIFAKQYERHLVECDGLRYHLSPASIFNGDMLLTANGPFGSFYIAVGDVTGHGLPAAVAALPTFSVFRAMTKKGKSVGAIAAEINNTLNDVMPTHMMLAMIIIEINAAATQLSVWCGGLPPMIIASEKGEIKQFIESKHLPLSVLEHGQFKQDLSLYNIEPNDRLYLYTDGIEEASNADGEMFGFERMKQLFDGHNHDAFASILHSHARFTRENEQDDDITLVELVCAENLCEQTSKPASKNLDDVVPWHSHIHLDANSLKNIEPIPQITQLLNNTVAVDSHQDYIATVLCELYSNALDHGILALDSSLKDTEDGFFEYYNLRRDRLNQLESASIDIELALVREEHDAFIDIVLRHSGEGFDINQQASNDANYTTDEDQAHGRGMLITQQLCQDIVYQDQGRVVTARYNLKGDGGI